MVPVLHTPHKLPERNDQAPLSEYQLLCDRAAVCLVGGKARRRVAADVMLRIGYQNVSKARQGPAGCCMQLHTLSSPAYRTP